MASDHGYTASDGYISKCSAEIEISWLQVLKFVKIREFYEIYKIRFLSITRDHKSVNYIIRSHFVDFNTIQLQCILYKIWTSLPKVIWEEAASRNCPIRTLCKVPIGYNGAPQIRPNSTPSRGAPDPIRRDPQCTGQTDRLTDRRTYRQIVHGKVWSLLGRCATTATRPNNKHRRRSTWLHDLAVSAFLCTVKIVNNVQAYWTNFIFKIHCDLKIRQISWISGIFKINKLRILNLWCSVPSWWSRSNQHF